MLDIFENVAIPSDERRGRLMYLLLHREERLLGRAKFPSSRFPWRSTYTGDHAGMGRVGWRIDLDQRTARLLRKLRKLRRDPKAFLMDSPLPGSRALSKML